MAHLNHEELNWLTTNKKHSATPLGRREQPLRTQIEEYIDHLNDIC